MGWGAAVGSKSRLVPQQGAVDQQVWGLLLPALGTGTGPVLPMSQRKLPPYPCSWHLWMDSMV